MWRGGENMAGNQIRMTPESMRSKAGEYSRQAENIQQIINNLDRLLQQLQQEWEGDSSRAYAEKFNQLRPGFVNVKNLVDEISTSLKKAAQIVEDTDKNIASQFKG